MSKVVVVGGSGHIGTYLVPELVRLGHHVINLSRGAAKPYLSDAAWTKVEHVTIDRDAAEAAGTFGAQVAELEADIVIDLICFTEKSAQHLVEALEQKISHFVHIGTIWVHGHSTSVPTRESDARVPTGTYGIQKSKIEDYLLTKARRDGFPATIVRPGHIVGPGWSPVNPAGHGNPAVFETIKSGKKLVLPNFGLETVHHVHAHDVAQMVLRSLNNWNNAVGEAFNAVSPAAITLRAFAEAMYAWYGHAPQLEYLPFEQWRQSQSEEDANMALEHISHSPCHSIEKAQRLLGYAPKYTSLEAVQQSVG